MKSRRLHAAILVITLLNFFTTFQETAAAQASNEAGIKLYGSYHGSDIDSVSLTSGHIELHLPLLDYPQRGALGLNFIVRYHTAIWNQTSECIVDPPKSCTLTWDNDGQPAISIVAAQTGPTVESGGFQSTVVFSDDSQHPIGALSATGDVWRTLDASGVKWVPGNSTVYFPNGTRIFNHPTINGAQVEEDVDGNQILFNMFTITDSLGRTIPDPRVLSSLPTTTDFSGCTGQRATLGAFLWHVPGANGSTNAFKICVTGVHIFTHHFPVDDAQH